MTAAMDATTTAPIINDSDPDPTAAPAPGLHAGMIPN